MKLSVIIVNNNMCALLRQALQTLVKACSGINHEIFVVDNASRDGSGKMIGQEFPQVNLVQIDRDLGYTKAANLALELVRGEYVLLINPDTITKKDTLHKVLEFMDAHPMAGGATVRMINPQGDFLPESKRGLTDAWIAFFKLTGLSKLLSKSRIYQRRHQYWIEEFETAEIDILSSAFMLLRQSVLQRTGLLDERFTTYGQDIDLSCRIRLEGFKNYYFPKTYIINYKRQQVDKFSWAYIKQFYGAMLIFAGKYMFKWPRVQLKLKGMGPIFPPSYEVER